MPQYKSVLTIALVLVLLTELAVIVGIFGWGGSGKRQIRSVRGENVTLYGVGLYSDMPDEVAPQGIAQDYVTLFVGIPLLLWALIMAQRGSIPSRMFLAGVLAYFVLTYLFWLNMSAYNDFFLIYVVLAGLSIWAFLIVVVHISPKKAKLAAMSRMPRQVAGGFLMLTSLLVAAMWLKVIIPPLLHGSYPKELYHFTTLVVQGIDLAYFLPFCFVTGLLFLKKSIWGYMFSPIILVFLSLQMLALLTKMVFMLKEGNMVQLPLMVGIGVIFVLAVSLANSCLRSFNKLA